LINTHHRAADFRSVFSSLPIKIEESFEPEILGTGGGIANARPELSTPLLVHNADIDCTLDYERLRRSVEGGGICLAIAPRPAGEGSVGVDAAGHVVRLRGECFGTEVRGGDYVGVGSLGADALADLPERGCLIGDYCLPRLRGGGMVHALCDSIEWNDIGSLATYVQSNLAWLKAHANGAHSSYLDPTAQLEPTVQVQGSIVGAGAHIGGVGKLERCIVWPGAQARAPLSDCVVTSGQQIVPFSP
jgi:NDP-sugar pyrophosphorylase family protein